ncbi:hypothetical protein IAQ61_001755 [Plenodomus lingam]|uniref:uncharacterized protein n=1 Tax=Leptosphaeria maculans TaxID=5022 RepID=UPI0033212A33|nr:hypothetical protein IAQ61_001755 [Plenodomus lingam]
MSMFLFLFLFTFTFTSTLISPPLPIQSQTMRRLLPPSIPLTSLLQYLFLAAIAYLLAGAPSPSSLSTFSFTADSSQAAHRTAALHAQTLENLAHPEPGLECAQYAYRGVYVLSREPLVVYIEGFVAREEAGEIVGLSNPHFTPSTIWNQGHETLDPKIRHSEKARLPRTPLIQCIEQRAHSFQGWRPYTFIEKLWAQRYGVGGHYTYHYDWSTATAQAGRVSSFMVYLEANCTGGGTHFPRLARPVGAQWCRFLECEGERERERGDGHAREGGREGGKGKSEEHPTQGIIFKPIPGNAIYWENMRPDGTGYWETWHAGLPVKTGVKIGLNIWTWFQQGHVP